MVSETLLIFSRLQQFYLIFSLLLTDGNEVDQECGLNENAHVFRQFVNQREIKYSVILGLVDIQNNKNSYYRMQLLESIDRRTNL